MACERNKNVIDETSVKSDPGDSDDAKRNDELPQLYNVLGTSSKTDLKLKISKLEAYSRQLCLNLKDLQKNREDITSKTLALSEELECHHQSEDDDEYISSDVEYNLLHADKSGCCTICKGYEGDAKNLKSNKEDVAQLSTISSVDEFDTSECSCCVCCESRISYKCFCEKCNDCESILPLSTYLTRNNFENTQTRRFSQDSEYFCICNNFEDSIEQYLTMCNCERGSNLEERCRGGGNNTDVDNSTDISSSTLLNRREEMSREESRSMESLLPVKKQDKMIETLSEALVSKSKASDISNNIFMENRVKIESKKQMNSFDRKEIFRFLEILDKKLREEDTGITTTKRKKSLKSDLFIGLIVLFVIICSRASRFLTLVSFSHCVNACLIRIFRIFDSISLVSTEFTKLLVRECIRGSENYGRYANFVSSHLTFVGAVLGSISFAKSVWSLAKILYICLRKDSRVSSAFTKFIKATKRNFQRVFRTKYHFYLFSYLSWLALGFFVGKISNVVDNWPLSWKVVTNNYLQF